MNGPNVCRKLMDAGMKAHCKDWSRPQRFAKRTRIRCIYGPLEMSFVFGVLLSFCFCGVSSGWRWVVFILKADQERYARWRQNGVQFSKMFKLSFWSLKLKNKKSYSCMMACRKPQPPKTIGDFPTFYAQPLANLSKKTCFSSCLLSRNSIRKAQPPHYLRA